MSADKYAALELDAEAVVTEYKSKEYTSAQLAKLTVGNNQTTNPITNPITTENGYITLRKGASNALVLDDDTNREVGYGKELTINAENKKYADTKWEYSDDADTKASFTITILSPIYEGVIAATDGSKNLSVVVNNEGGANITKNMISLTDYANNKYNVVPDDKGTAYNNELNTSATGTAGDDIWKAKQITNVWADETGDNTYLKSISLKQETDATKDPGAIVLVAQPTADFSEPTEVTVHVKDVWGYVVAQPLNITLTKAE